MNETTKWFKIAGSGTTVPNGGRLHVKIDGRYITVFRHKGVLSAIDSICHHAGGPLTLGPLQDIEDLGITVVLCPWHKFMVGIHDGVKAYQGVDFVGGKPVHSGWKTGKIVQRAHLVAENPAGLYLCPVISEEPCSSDNDASSDLCAQDYNIHIITNTPASDEEVALLLQHK